MSEAKQRSKGYAIVARTPVPNLGLPTGAVLTFHPGAAPGRRLIGRTAEDQLSWPCGMERWAFVTSALGLGLLALTDGSPLAQVLWELERCEEEPQPIPPGPIDVDKAIAALSAPPRRPPVEERAYNILDPAGYERLKRAVQAIRRRRHRGR